MMFVQGTHLVSHRESQDVRWPVEGLFIEPLRRVEQLLEDQRIQARSWSYFGVVLSNFGMFLNLLFLTWPNTPHQLGYTNSPELRISWLENLAQFHLSKENYEDAAQCKLYIAHMVTKVLRFLFTRQNNSVALSGKSSACLLVPRHANYCVLRSVARAWILREGRY